MSCGWNCSLSITENLKNNYRFNGKFFRVIISQRQKHSKPFRNDLCQLVNFCQMSMWYQTLNPLMDIQVCVFMGLTLRADVDTSRES